MRAHCSPYCLSVKLHTESQLHRTLTFPTTTPLIMLAPFHPPLICALLLLSSQITNYYAESQAPHVSLLRTRYSCVHEGFDWPTACSPPRGLSLDSSFPCLPISLSLLPLYFFCQSLSLSHPLV